MIHSYFLGVHSKVGTEGLYFIFSLKYLDPTPEPVKGLCPLRREIRTIGLLSCDEDVP